MKVLNIKHSKQHTVRSIGYIKLKASSILEPIIASVVLTIGVSTFSLSLGNVISLGNASKKIDIQSTLNELGQQSINKDQLIDGSFSYENFTVIRTVEKYDQQDKLYVVTLKAIDKENEVIQETKQVVRVVSNKL